MGKDQNFLGKHLLIEMFEVQEFDTTAIQNSLFEIANVVRGTVIYHHFHFFSAPGAMTGFLLLAESHISVHTWPEKNFVSLDVFMCNDFDLDLVKKVLIQFYQTDKIFIKTHKVGQFLN